MQHSHYKPTQFNKAVDIHPASVTLCLCNISTTQRIQITHYTTLKHVAGTPIIVQYNNIHSNFVTIILQVKHNYLWIAETQERLIKLSYLHSIVNLNLQ